MLNRILLVNLIFKFFVVSGRFSSIDSNQNNADFDDMSWVFDNIEKEEINADAKIHDGRVDSWPGLDLEKSNDFPLFNGIESFEDKFTDSEFESVYEPILAKRPRLNEKSSSSPLENEYLTSCSQSCESHESVFDGTKPHYYAEEIEKTPQNELVPLNCRSNIGINSINEQISSNLMQWNEAHEILLKRYRVETNKPVAKHIHWKFLDRSAIPDQYNDIELNSQTILRPIIFKNSAILDNIHFFSKSSSPIIQANPKASESLDAINILKQTENRAKIIFMASLESDRLVFITCLQSKTYNEIIFKCRQQLPYYYCSNLFLYDLKNWPEGVSKLKDRWDRSSCERIKANMSLLQFIPINDIDKRPLSVKILGLIPDITLDPSITKKKAHEILLQKFRTETGRKTARFISWSLLDRSAIPEKYSEIVFDSNAMKFAQIYQNLEIIENIHFRNE